MHYDSNSDYVNIAFIEEIPIEIHISKNILDESQ